MVYTSDLKSLGLTALPVRVRPWAPRSEEDAVLASRSGGCIIKTIPFGIVFIFSNAISGVRSLKMRARNNGPRLSYSESLKEVELFAVKVAQSLVEGEITRPNHPQGDLYNADVNCFYEVKGSQLSAGPIICEEQLARHHEDLERSDQRYVFVMYEGRVWKDGRYQYLTVRMGRRGQNVLRRFLASRIRKVYVLHVSVVMGIYEFHRQRGDIQEYMMQRGLKRYVKIPDTDLRSLGKDRELLRRFSLEPLEYIADERLELGAFRNFRLQVPVVRVLPNPILDVGLDWNFL